MKYKRGDVVLALFPNSDLRSAKRRPVVVVQNDELETGLAQFIVAMITSNKLRAGHPSRVAVTRSSAEGKRSGLLTDLVIMTDNLATLLERAFDRRIGSLPMGRIDVALKRTLALG
jgi:mRNA interferase MazF